MSGPCQRVLVADATGYIGRQLVAELVIAAGHQVRCLARTPDSTWLSALRGWLDRMVGGVGTRRGHRHPTDLRVGDVVDFWRVEALEPGCLLRLRAEMRGPGDAWLERSITPELDGVLFVQRAVFRPRGLFGRGLLVLGRTVS